MQTASPLKNAIVTFASIFAAFILGTLVKGAITGTGFDPSWMLILSSSFLGGFTSYLTTAPSPVTAN